MVTLSFLPSRDWIPTGVCVCVSVCACISVQKIPRAFALVTSPVFFFLLRQGLAQLLRLGSDMESSYLSLPEWLGHVMWAKGTLEKDVSKGCYC